MPPYISREVYYTHQGAPYHTQGVLYPPGYPPPTIPGVYYTHHDTRVVYVPMVLRVVYVPMVGRMSRVYTSGCGRMSRVYTSG